MVKSALVIFVMFHIMETLDFNVTFLCSIYQRMQLKSLHSQLNRLCAAIANNGQGKNSFNQIAKAQEIIRDR